MARTKGGKPFEASGLPRPPSRANFNFNVSHEGDWVVLASEPLCVCGREETQLGAGESGASGEASRAGAGGICGSSESPRPLLRSTDTFVRCGK